MKYLLILDKLRLVLILDIYTPFSYQIINRYLTAVDIDISPTRTLIYQDIISNIYVSFNFFLYIC